MNDKSSTHQTGPLITNAANVSRTYETNCWFLKNTFQRFRIWLEE